jgi:YD repeat-containing protein
MPVSRKPLRALVRFAVLAAAAAAAGVQAQGLIDLVPRQEFTDANGVDITNAVYRHHETLLQIGGGAHPLALNLHFTSPGLEETGQCPSTPGQVSNTVYVALDSHAYFGNTAIGTADFTIVLPHQSAKFGIYGGWPNRTIIPADATYVTASFDPTETHLSYIGGDGTEATMSTLHKPNANFASAYHWGTADLIKFPDGETWTYRYNDVQYTPACGGSWPVSRIRSIVSSRGYGIQFNYAADASGTVTSQTAIQNFMAMTRATAYNKASVYCDEAALASCAPVTALNTAVTFAYNQAGHSVTITKPNGEQITFAFDPYRWDWLTSVSRPGGATRTMTYREWSEQEGPTYRALASLTEAGRTWLYDYGPGHYASGTGVTEPSGAFTAYWFDQNGAPDAIDDPLNRHTGLGYDGWMRFLQRVYPEGNEVTAAYDARGNLNLVKHIPKPGSGLPTLQSSAVFPASCTAADRRTCNRPTSVTDRNGNVTDYTYAAAHGGLLTETGPAVPTRQNNNIVVSIRPQKRYEYAQRYAWTANGAGGWAQAATPVWLLVRERSCRTTAASGATCAGGAADEIVTDYDYGPNSGPNILQLRGVAVTADGGAGIVTRRTCYGYDDAGNRISETRPNANPASCP